MEASGSIPNQPPPTGRERGGIERVEERGCDDGEEEKKKKISVFDLIGPFRIVDESSFSSELDRSTSAFKSVSFSRKNRKGEGEDFYVRSSKK